MTSSYSRCPPHKVDRRLTQQPVPLDADCSLPIVVSIQPNPHSTLSRWQTDLMQFLPCLSFGSLLMKADHKTDTAVPCTADRTTSAVSIPTFAFPALVHLPADYSSQGTGQTIVRRGERRRRTSPYTTTAQTKTCLLHLPTHMHLMGDLG